jgi:formylglycine-generating enzyme required for sulfatase activity
MKKFVLATVLFAVMAAFRLNAALPRLAVVEFSTNSGIEKVRQDSVTVRNLVESQMAAAGKYQIISCADIDKLLAKQQIQVSRISSSENIKKLQLQNISYIVTGSVDAMGSHYSITVRILDVSYGQFFHSACDFMGGGSRELNDGVNTLISNFMRSMGSVGRQVVPNAALPPPPPPPPPPAPSNMVFVEGGSFLMGNPSSDRPNERPVHPVQVRSFYMGKYEVTQKEWVAIMGTNPSNWKGNDLPVETVTWYEAVEYCNRLSLKEGLTPAYRWISDSSPCNFTVSGYRLPTEAEWEYAAKGGKQGDFLSYDYSGGNSVDAVGWYSENSGGRTHRVGTKLPNGLGLYDMSGNVWEWCWDWFQDYPRGAQTNPMGACSGASRVLRGGSWVVDGQFLRSACRYFNKPSDRGSYFGFRLLRPGL